MISVHDIRTAYPNPVSARDLTEESDPGYCVGGAFTLSLNSGYDAFPSVSHLAYTLSKAHGNQPVERFVDYAFAIIEANDEGAFEEAWMFLENALKT